MLASLDAGGMLEFGWDVWQASARASLPAPTDADALWKQIEYAVEQGLSIDNEKREFYAALRARPPEPTPTVDVLRREELRDRVILAAKAVSYSNGFDAALPDKKAELYEALKALEKP
jgi:hypothetical protein